jgi:hypothetical protein
VANRSASSFLALALALALVACKGNKNREKLEMNAKAEATKPQVDVAPVAADDLCVTKGTLVKAGSDAAPRLEVDVPTFRAVGLGTTGEAVALDFIYRGHSTESRALASGQMRRQLGLKLRAANGCNLVYVMWRLDPKPELEISIKVNPGMTTHAECGANGYTKLKKPSYRIAVPALLEGEHHVLQAEIAGNELFAWIDNELTWRGGLPDEAKNLAGPSGFRSDNLKYEVTALKAPSGLNGAAKPKCVPIEEDDGG